MADISKLIEPKSDQLNSDDLAAGDRTIRITEVKVLGSGREQPIHIHFDGDNGKPWKPCKTMARLLANLWGSPDTSTWTGKSVTIYRDPDVLWAGAKIGGIRVRAVSHIDAPRQVAITESKAKRKLARIEVITADVTPMKQRQTAEQWAAEHMEAIAQATDADTLDALCNRAARAMAKLADSHPDTHRALMNAADARRAELSREGKPDDQMGEAFNDDAGFGEDA